jgi:hypothetical protein
MINRKSENLYIYDCAITIDSFGKLETIDCEQVNVYENGIVECFPKSKDRCHFITGINRVIIFENS